MSPQNYPFIAPEHAVMDWVPVNLDSPAREGGWAEQQSFRTKFISKNCFCFNPVDFRQLYICIIAFLLSNLSRGKLPISYFLLTEAHYEPCFTF